MAGTATEALSSWFRSVAAAVVADPRGHRELHSPLHASVLYREAAERFDHLQPVTSGLFLLMDSKRSGTFYDDVVFVGGGPAVATAKSKAVNADGASGQSVLAAVIEAASSEAPPSEFD